MQRSVHKEHTFPVTVGEQESTQRDITGPHQGGVKGPAHPGSGRAHQHHMFLVSHHPHHALGTEPVMKPHTRPDQSLCRHSVRQARNKVKPCPHDMRRDLTPVPPRARLAPTTHPHAHIMQRNPAMRTLTAKGVPTRGKQAIIVQDATMHDSPLPSYHHRLTRGQL